LFVVFSGVFTGIGGAAILWVTVVMNRDPISESAHLDAQKSDFNELVPSLEVDLKSNPGEHLQLVLKHPKYA
jgi:hypothetical protein